MKILFAKLGFIGPLYSITLYLSANLNGRFNAHDLSEKDFMLDFATALNEARSIERGFYIDLGNGFYPGALSRFSYGGLTADFFLMLRLDAALVAANDLNLGADNLNFIRKTRGLHLLSANIVRKGKSLFPAYHIIEAGGNKIALIGLTNPFSNIDYAEKEIFKTEIKDGAEELANAISEAKAQGAMYFILLSGQDLASSLGLLGRFSEISLIILGGDYSGELAGQQISHIKLADGRHVVALNSNMGFYRMKLAFREGRLEVENLSYHPVEERRDNRHIPRNFLRRRQLWLHGYLRTEAAQAVDLPAEGFSLDVAFLGALARRDLRCEVAIVSPLSVKPERFQGRLSPGMLRERIFDDYRIFWYKLSGEELEQISRKDAQLMLSGLKAGQIQGYPLAARQEYLVCSSQRVLERVEKLLGKRYSARNSWLSHGSLAANRIRNREFVSTAELAHEADQLWRFRLEGQLSNLIENAAVENEIQQKTPPGQPRASYLRYGLENMLDFYFYNRYHEFILSPYINYARQDALYLQNLLRGSFTYNYHPDFFLHPYHKSQIDTVVRVVNNQRPTLIRETIGLQLNIAQISGRLGFGFEKKILDPVDIPFWGLEVTTKYSFTLWQKIVYRFSLDSFFSTYELRGRWQIRSELTNTLTFLFYEPLSFSLRYRRFYFYSLPERRIYDARIFTISADLRTNLKFF